MLQIAKGGVFCLFIATFGFLWFDHHNFEQLQQQNKEETAQTHSISTQESYISYKVQSLEQFISFSLKDYESPQGILRQEEESQFKYLTAQHIRLKTDSDLNLASEFHKVKEIKKMQKLATYISDQYDVKLENAEQIVLNSFVESDRHGVEPLLVLSVIGVESTYKQYSKSHMGAIGLTQVVPTYHQAKIKELKSQNMDIWSVQGNIRLGTQILSEYIDLAKGNVSKGLQMYNGSLNDSSKSYSKKVLNKMQRLNTVVAQV